MRELKFRAWDGKQFHYWGFNADDSGAYYTGPPVISRVAHKNLQHEQFTGLHDRNGVDIFEGDIVKGYINFGPAGDLRQIWAIRIDPLGPNVQGWQWREGTEWAIPLVIGNIHESPELLEEEK